MRNSEVTCGALRIVHFEVKEDSGSLTFEGAIPDDVKSFSARLYFDDFPSSDVDGCYLDVIKGLCRPSDS